ncbi:hypothetical protein AQUCO_02300016v1 [Aquilegia coerulea]|uniref:tRNA/rRNA methyltransferase SpoU type domain-containing protein n=1 Tax=Aquilegia coerulea TaxID=218851 RepID=A0A2G5DBQ4_AQUCA|nr:hypothetical protein AQUCO_02300016v1 [Aquilegia coerulea]
MDSLVSSLMKSFTSVPCAAIPSILDCILTSTAVSSSSLFDSLLDVFSDILKDICKQDHGNSSLVQSSYISSFTTSLCHLLKKSGTDTSVLQSFIWRGFLPVMKTINSNDHELLNLITEQLSDVIIESNMWEVIKVSLVPFLLSSVGLSIGMNQNEDSALYQWSGYSIIHGPVMQNGLCVDKESVPPLYDSFPLAISCHILTSLLVASSRSHQTLQRPLDPMVLSGCSAEIFFQTLLWDVCSISIQMLSKSPDHRFCTIHLVLPFILRTFACDASFQISVHGRIHVLSRDSFSRNIWKCCQALFSLGPLERRDAYSVLSLYISILYSKESHRDITLINGDEEFDIRAEQEFWEEIKKGLVGKEAFVRKQSLDILKITLSEHDERPCYTGLREMNMHERSSTSLDLTKKGQWADKEAKSLGVGQVCNVTDDNSLSGQQRWGAFILLYEMLEEYGTHLVEAAWYHQISMLLQFPCPQRSSWNKVHQSQLETLKGMFSWLAVLWERGLCHENPQVRGLIMQSFLSINWEDHGTCTDLVPESFIIGPFVQGLNDTVHHREFGVKGVYSSATIVGATNFMSQYSKHFHWRERISFMCSLASVAKQESFGRAGLMALSACIAYVACGQQWCEVCPSDVDKVESTGGIFSRNIMADLLDMLKLLVESCKQHFNVNYRRRVCENLLEAVSSVICTSDVPLEALMHFFSTVPREFTDYGGSLREVTQKWFAKCSERSSESFTIGMQVLHSLCNFPKRFIEYHHSPDACITCDDGDLEAWEFEGQRWARLFFIVMTKEHHLEFIFKFLQNYGVDICKQHNHLEWLPLKFLILNLSLVQELRIIKMKSVDCSLEGRSNMESLLDTSDHNSVIFDRFTVSFLYILEEIVSYAKLVCSTFWCDPAVDTHLPSSVRGKLGGPSQRRLATCTTTAVLKAILSMQTIASLSSWCTQFKSDGSLDFMFTFLWSFAQKVILSPKSDFDSETGAEISLAAYEALVPVLKAVASSITPANFDQVMITDKSLLPKDDDRHWLDILVLSFLQNINKLLSHGKLARSRRAILMNWKWLCLNSLLAIQHCMIKNAVHLGREAFFLSAASVKCLYSDLIESLENANESSVLPMLRSVRLVLQSFASGGLIGFDDVLTEMMWELVHSSWILHVSCNKRKVAHIAVLLSSVLHCSLFCDEGMHETTENTQGPLKWFIEKVIDESTRSPRTIRLSALHLTGLWLLYPRTIIHYIKELKLLSLYGSVAFDEDFEAELAESHEARTEVSLLARNSNNELTEAFMNTELYARVSVAVLFYELADLADKIGSTEESEDCYNALQAGKAFLLELLDSVVNDKDLAKELYKKYSAIHRRKVRAWQMICTLSRYVDEDIVQQVTSSLHICLYRNNLPSVRQYLEIFAIQIYLRFPSLVEEQLGPILRDYNMRPQALSSYVFIAANVILHATEEVARFMYLSKLLPPIFPLLTSHHHSLRGFTQLLVYQVLFKMLPSLDCNGSDIMPLEKKCFKDLKCYLEKNSDCLRLRASMEGFLDAFDPVTSATPTGIFTARDEGVDFECVPTSLMEQLNKFLNEVREELRCSMTNDMVIINSESLATEENCKGMAMSPKGGGEGLSCQVPRDLSLDFQKKITLSKHEKQHNDVSSLSGSKELCKSLAEMEKEDLLLNKMLQSRNLTMEKIKASQQDLILVASLLDRIPNLAGLARTCEVCLEIYINSQYVST